MIEHCRTPAACLVFLTVFLASCGPDAAPDQPAEALAEGSVRLSEEQGRAAGIVTERVQPKMIRTSIRVPGSVQSPDTARSTIGSIVEGRVETVRVLPGDRVRRGQPLVEVHAHELSEARRDLTSALADSTFRENALSRSESLLEAGAVALEEVERRRADLVAAEAELERARERIAHLNPSASGHVTAVAPTDGTVFSVHARRGQAVLPGTPLVEMGGTDVLWVTAFVPEHVAGLLVVGDDVEVRFTSPSADASARLVRVGDVVDASSRSVEVRFELATVPRGVRPGSFAVVAVATSETFEAVELDDEAAVRLGSGDAVFVVVGRGAYRAVPVDVTPTQEGRVIVRGIPPGSEVVVEGAYFLKAALELDADPGEGGAA